ncbi:MAG TPA: hypothetical protein VHO84_10540 [Syntrophorhabdaceae bacterium]|nr:hypothetical protein [Syntrophorhabdaceae bacterium]
MWNNIDETKAKQEQTEESGDQIIYRPTFRTVLVPTLFVSIISLALFISAVKSGRPVPAVFSFIFIGFLLAIRFKLKIIVDAKQVKYVGLLSTKTILFSDIVHAGWMFQHGFSRDRFFGSLVYEILSKRESIRINFRFFPMDRMNPLVQRLEHLSAELHTGV